MHGGRVMATISMCSRHFNRESIMKAVLEVSYIKSMNKTAVAYSLAQYWC